MTLLVELMEQRIPGVPEQNLRIKLVKYLYGRVEREALVAVEERFPALSA